MVDTIFPYPLHNSPRLPLLHQPGDSHPLPIHTAQHKSKFRRVDAELAYLHNPPLLMPPLLPQLHHIAATSTLQLTVAVKTARQYNHLSVQRLRYRMQYVDRLPHNQLSFLMTASPTARINHCQCRSGNASRLAL